MIKKKVLLVILLLILFITFMNFMVLDSKYINSCKDEIKNNAIMRSIFGNIKKIELNFEKISINKQDAEGIYTFNVSGTKRRDKVLVLWSNTNNTFNVVRIKIKKGFYDWLEIYPNNRPEIISDSKPFLISFLLHLLNFSIILITYGLYIKNKTFQKIFNMLSFNFISVAINKFCLLAATAITLLLVLLKMYDWLLF